MKRTASRDRGRRKWKGLGQGQVFEAVSEALVHNMRRYEAWKTYPMVAVAAHRATAKGN
jgi:hypothetical protein